MAFQHGRFVWRELATADVAAARRFYGEVFGWAFDEVPMPQGTYTIARIGEEQVAGLFEMGDMPSARTTYVSVADVDATAAAFQEAGGAVHMAPMDVEGVGRFAVVADPQGAAVGLLHNEGGDPELPASFTNHSFCWESLNTSDVAAASRFYYGVFPWKPASFGGMDVFAAEVGAIAGANEAPPGVPPHWLVNLTVEDLPGVLERVRAHGGTVMMEPMAMPGVGTLAIIQDPVGVASMTW